MSLLKTRIEVMLRQSSQPEKMSLTSMDIAEEKRQQLKQIFPEIFCEDKIDFDQLRRILGECVEPDKERFGLNWPGKAECMKIIQQPSLGTLKPCRAESVNFDETENIFIEGENLEVLKLLQKTYFGKVKMIYIDPPYNTGNDFIYPDDYKDSLNQYMRYTGQVDDEGRKFSTNSDRTGRFHSNWLNMMYPRLYIARQLLRDDGVIFISIDDHEQANLKALCDQIFGEENFLACLIWKSGRTASSHFTNENEYIFAFAKSIKSLPFFQFEGNDIISDRTIKRESAKNIASEITFPPGIRFESDDKIFSTQLGAQERVEVVSGIFECRNRKLLNQVTLRAPWAMKDQIIKWLRNEEVVDQKGQDIIDFFFKSNGILQYKKNRIFQHPKTTIDGISTKVGTNEIKHLLSTSIFEFPKPTNLIKFLCKIVCSDNDNVIVDFFSGSGTTADAIMQLNAEDGGNRKYICVQIPEPCDEQSEAYKAGYKTIADIAKERICRAAKEIAKEENPDKVQNVDLGFKVFKLDESNFKIWNNDQNDFKKNPARQLEFNIDHIKPDSSVEDILFEILLKDGLPLTTKIEKKQFAGKDVYSIEDDTLLICLDKQITSQLIDAMAAANPSRVICLDAGFRGNDQLKVNTVQTFKTREEKQEREIVFRTV